ncbi:MAG: FAD-dependent oxidoreductase [Sedimentisphaerales bacterium]|nr:FAD-dependent oxidoreductase [Sedimentisphaerales bacterium]
MSRTIIIVGGVAGGASAAARLRRLDEEARIILFERGEYISFANCGLPYYIGGAIQNREDLLLQSPQGFRARFNVDVRVRQEVVSIDRQSRRVEVVDHADGKRYWQAYDKLILSPGAEPIRPPLEGIDSSRIFTLRNVPDMDRIDAFIRENRPQRAVVVGAGYIGLEMAENLRDRGLLVALVEMADQVMPVLDKEMAWYVQRHLENKDVAVWLDDAVAGFEDVSSGLHIHLKSGMQLSCNMAILAIGVRPEVDLARQAGLEIGPRGGIAVNDRLETGDPDIYAIGDAIEVNDLVFGGSALIPLAGPANKQGRMVADILCGRQRRYRGSQGTGILKVFDLAVAMTGASEKQLRNKGMEYEKLYIHPAHHVGYYPGATTMHMKALFDKKGRILGAQIVGHEGVDRRIDLLAVAIRMQMTVYDLQELELAYAPPFGSGKDAVNMAGFVGVNLLDGTTPFRHFDALEPDDFILDVRTRREYERGHVPGALHIPVDELRNRLHELPRDKVICAYCSVGIRSHTACRILNQSGFQARNLGGGYLTYCSFMHHEYDRAESCEQLKKEFCTGL